MNKFLFVTCAFWAGSISLCSGLKCYHCNSTAYQEKCGSDFQFTATNGSHVKGGCDICTRIERDMQGSKESSKIVNMKEWVKKITVTISLDPDDTPITRTVCTVYIRGCFKSAPNAVSFRSGCSKRTEKETKLEECFCNDDLCNRAGQETTNFLMVVISLSAVLYCVH